MTLVNGDDLEEREAQLKAQLKQVQAEKKERDAKVCELIGQAVKKRMESDQAFASQVREILDGEVRAKRDRKLLGLSENPVSRDSQSAGQDGAGRPAVNG